MDVHGTKLARTLFTGSTPVASAPVVLGSRQYQRAAR